MVDKGLSSASVLNDRRREVGNVSHVGRHRSRYRGGWPALAMAHATWGFAGLPGDIFIQRQGFTFYAPITTGILVSVVLSLILWLFSR